MSRDKIRGKEVSLQFSVDSVLYDAFLVTNFRVTERADLPEVDLIGSATTDIDYVHNGYDLSWTSLEADHQILDLLEDITSRDRRGLPHPDVKVTVFYSYREPTAQGRVVTYHDMRMMQNDHGFEGRTEYVSSDFSAKAKRRSVLRG